MCAHLNVCTAEFSRFISELEKTKSFKPLTLKVKQFFLLSAGTRECVTTRVSLFVC
jgi:hypothetical protein